MEELYSYAGISRQAYFQHWQREFKRLALESSLLDKVDALRINLSCCCKKMAMVYCKGGTNVRRRIVGGGTVIQTC